MSTRLDDGPHPADLTRRPLGVRGVTGGLGESWRTKVLYGYFPPK